MKKYLYLFVALICTLSACMDSNEIDMIQQKEVTFNVNVAGVYESWGMDDFKNYLGNNKSTSIGIFTFIYDKTGQLTKKIVSRSKIMQTVSLSVENIKAGDYEVVTLVTIINDDDEESSIWQIVDEENLNSLMIAFKDGYSVAYWYHVFGLANTSVKIGENSSVNITPKPEGCIINFAYENFEQLHFNYFSFSSRNNADGLRLALNLSDTDRYYIKNYDQSNTWGSLGYFYAKSPAEIDHSDSYAFYTFETGQRPYLFAGSKNMFVDGKNTFDIDVEGTFNYEDGKEYVAFAFYVGAPEYFKTYVGPLDKFNSWYNSLDKTMNPIFAEPCTQWGCSVNAVKTFMNGYELVQDITEGNYGGYYITYLGKYKEYYIEYDFESKTSGLYAAFVLVWDMEASSNEIFEMLNDSKYTYKGYIEEGEDFSYYLYSDGSTDIGVFPNQIDADGYNYTVIQYVKNEDNDQSNTRTIQETCSKLHRFNTGHIISKKI